MKKIIIYGFGRMGLTHYAILNQIVKSAEFTFVDPNWKVNYFARKNLHANVLNSGKEIDDNYDYALICTPPTFHISILENCIKSNVTDIFVEKPFGGVNDNFTNAIQSSHNISVGYVLRFNPVVQWIKENIDPDKVKSVDASYFSNTIEKKPKGWRNGLYSGVTNEVGAHIIDLCNYLFGLKNPVITDKKYYSVVSDVDDILITDLNEKCINYHFHFDWVNKAYRKPVFKFVLTMQDGTLIKFDQQKVERFCKDNLVERVSLVDIAQQVPFYLRGVEFTAQMEDFLGLKKNIATVSDAMTTRNLINKLILE